MRWLVVLLLLLSCGGRYQQIQKPPSDYMLLQKLRKQTVQVVSYCKGMQYAQGTGVLLGGGRVATAEHVIPDGCTLRLDGKLGVVEHRDESADVAVVAFMGLLAPFVKYSTPYLGQEVICIGYAHQLYTSESTEQITRGYLIVEYKGKKPRYRVSCSFQKGASGGPVFDNQGNLVGLMTSMMEPLPNMPAVDQFIVSPAKAVQELLHD